MESIGGNELRSMTYGDRNIGVGFDSYHFTEEFQRLMASPPVSGNSFTALLELPANQAMELLHCSETDESSAVRLSAADVVKRQNMNNQIPRNHTLDCAPAFPSNNALIERAAKYSVFVSGDGTSGGSGQDSPGYSSVPSNSSANAMKVKCEPADTGSNPNSSTQAFDPTFVNNNKTMKRKEREKKGKNSSKKSKTAANENTKDVEKLPYVHVRARRGEATDSHSLAERARREKINARMKFLQELVPGCNKISGTALVLDEIINHVQSLQHQVELLSMKLAAVNPRIDFNFDSLFMAGNGSVMDSNSPNIVNPLMWPEVLVNGERQLCQQQLGFDSLNQPVWPSEPNHSNLITPENSLLSYDSSANSASLPTNQLKMEL